MIKINKDVCTHCYWIALYDPFGIGFNNSLRETKQGIRFTVSESARRKILDGLLALNHERHAEEVAQGLHAKGSKSKSPRKKAIGEEEELF